MKKCIICQSYLSDGNSFDWKCTRCNKNHKVSISTLKKIKRKLRDNTYKDSIKCTQCNNHMVDGHEKISYYCKECGSVLSGNLSFFTCRNNKKLKREKLLELIFKILPIVISGLALCVTFIFNSFNTKLKIAELEPKFSLYLDSEQKNEDGIVIPVYKFHIEGGQIISPLLKVDYFLKFKFADNKKYIIRIGDYFSEECPFNISEKSFIIKETKKEEIRTFLDHLCKIAEKEDSEFDKYKDYQEVSEERPLLDIDEICIKKVYYINYQDYKMDKHQQIFVNKNYYEYWSDRLEPKRKALRKEIPENKIQEIDIEKYNDRCDIMISGTYFYENYSDYDDAINCGSGCFLYPAGLVRNVSGEKKKKILKEYKDYKRAEFIIMEILKKNYKYGINS